MPKKKSSSKRDDRDVESEAAEMREMAESELDAVSYNDSGHASDGHSHQTRDDDSDADDDMSDRSSVTLNDPKELMKKLAKERLRRCIVFMKEFWKFILFLIQTGVVGAIGLTAYYMEFQDIFPRKHTVFNCDDRAINQTTDASVFEYFIFGENIDEQWIYLFSFMAPPGIMFVVEFLYMLNTGCMLSHHLKAPLILRRMFRFVGNYVFGVMACLVIAKTIKLFTATPRPYFMSICQPNVTFCVEATEAICTNTNVTELNDARTSLPSMAVSALSYACLFTGVYLHQMIKRTKAIILQPLAVTLFIIISLLGASIELGVKRSHWYDILAGYILGSFQAAYQVTTLNFFVENFQPPLPIKRDDTFMQTDPMPEPESDDEYPYDDIMMGKLPKKKKRDEPMDIPCFHRATSFDNTFQSDMARSLNMFKTMSNVWASDRPPTFGTGSPYDQGLQHISEESTTRVQIQPASPTRSTASSKASISSKPSEKKKTGLTVPIRRRRESGSSVDSVESTTTKSKSSSNRLRVNSETRSSRRTSIASTGSEVPRSPRSPTVRSESGASNRSGPILEVHASAE